MAKKWEKEVFAVAVGDEEGTCCTIEHGIKQSDTLSLMSASKMVTGYVILGLVNEGKLTLNTLVKDILPWWTATDLRSKVRVHHLLENTDGLPTFKIFGMCTQKDVIGCAKEAYGRGVKDEPGTTFTYSETSFYVLGAIAIQVSGLPDYNAVFQKYVAEPSNMYGCSFTGQQDPGAMLQCSTVEYAKFLRLVAARALNGLPKSAFVEAEKPRTKKGVKSMAMFGMGLPQKQEYGLGLWRMCATKSCSDDEIVYVHSMGANGFIPSIYRLGGTSTWLIVARNVLNGIPKSMDILRDLQPQAVPFSLAGVPTDCEMGCLGLTLKRGIKKVAKKIGETVKKIGKKIKKGVRKIKKGVRKVKEGVKKVAKKVRKGAKKVVKKVTKGVKKVAKKVTKGVKKIFSRRRRTAKRKGKR